MGPTTNDDIERVPAHLRGLLRDLHNLVFQRDYRIVPATTRITG